MKRTIIIHLQEDPEPITQHRLETIVPAIIAVLRHSDIAEFHAHGIAVKITRDNVWIPVTRYSFDERSPKG